MAEANKSEPAMGCFHHLARGPALGRGAARAGFIDGTNGDRTLRGGSGDGRKLVTLRDPALYVTKLPKADHDADA
jgi:hypothetical protein